MKSSGRKIKHKLLVTNDPVILFLGLVTPEPDYKTSLLLNNALGTQFKSTSPIVITVADDRTCSFSRFSSGARFNDTSFELVTNRNKDCIVDRKFTGLDYLMIIKGSEIADTRDEIVTRIRAITEITAVFVLDDNITIADGILQQIS